MHRKLILKNTIKCTTPTWMNYQQVGIWGYLNKCDNFSIQKEYHHHHHHRAVLFHWWIEPSLCNIHEPFWGMLDTSLLHYLVLTVCTLTKQYTPIVSTMPQKGQFPSHSCYSSPSCFFFVFLRVRFRSHDKRQFHTSCECEANFDVTNSQQISHKGWIVFVSQSDSK